MSLVAHALTSRARLKEYLGIDVGDTSKDAILDSLINRATDWFESVTGRRYKKATYDELYDGGSDKLFLKNYPVRVLTSIKFRENTIAAPTYKDFNANDFVIYKEAGYIQFLFRNTRTISGVLVSGATTKDVQSLRANYEAGFLIDFGFPTDPLKHNLPFDIEDIVIRMTSKSFNRRKADGVSQESVEGASITWANPTKEQLSATDRSTISKYSRKHVASSNPTAA